MKRTIVAVLLFFAVGLLTGCNKESAPPSTVASQSRSESAPALQPVADRVAAPDEKGTALPAPTSEQQAACEALEKRAPEIDRGYTFRFSDGLGMVPENDQVNKGVKIERKGLADAEYSVLKDCLRNADDNLKQEKPLLSFNADVEVQGLKFGMTRAEIEQHHGNVLWGTWRTDGCKQVGFERTAYTCTYWHDMYLAYSGLDRAHSAHVLTVDYDDVDRVIAWEFLEFYPARDWKSPSDIIRAERKPPNGGAVAWLEIPDTENESSADWNFHSKSQKDRFGMPKVLESVHLIITRQGSYWGIAVTYTDKS